jgi:hypothetical protein
MFLNKFYTIDKVESKAIKVYYHQDEFKNGILSITTIRRI